MKKYVLRFLLIIGVVLIYEVVGALAPFVFQKQVEDEEILNQPVSQYYSDGVSVDRACVIEANDEALSVRLEMINNAKESIIFSTFDIRDGYSTTDIFSALIDAANRGVDVKILVDGLYGKLHMKEIIFEAAGSYENIEIKFYNTPNLLKPWTINGRLHDKYIIIDHRLLLLGGRNTFDYFVGKYPDRSTGNDREVFIYNQAYKDINNNDSVIYQVEAYFEKVWNLSDCKTVLKKNLTKSIKKEQKRLMEHYESIRNSILVKTDVDWEKETVPINKATFIANPTNIGGKEPFIWYQLKELMKTAKSSVTIQTPYAVFSKDMYKGMTEITAEVPQVEMLINSTAVGDNIMASSDYTFNKDKILDTSVTVYEYFGSHSCHGKSITVDDDISVIGSYNLDMRSTYIDTETMIVIHGKEFNTLLNQHLSTFKEESLEVNPEEGYHYDSTSIVSPKELQGFRNFSNGVLSWLIQLFRYLV